MIAPQKQIRYIEDSGDLTTEGWLLLRDMAASIAALQARGATVASPLTLTDETTGALTEIYVDDGQILHRLAGGS